MSFSYVWLCNPMDCSLPGSHVHGTFPARFLAWNLPFLLQGIFPTQGSNLGLPHCRKTPYRLSHQGSPWCSIARSDLFIVTVVNISLIYRPVLKFFFQVSLRSVAHSCLTPWTIALQAPLSMEFSGQEYWRGLPFTTPGDLPNPGIEPGSLALQADSLLLNFTVEWSPDWYIMLFKKAEMCI